MQTKSDNPGPMAVSPTASYLPWGTQDLRSREYPRVTQNSITVATIGASYHRSWGLERSRLRGV